MSVRTYLQEHPDLRVIIFAGLPGQGKSTLAAAAAWRLAGRGERVLLFSSVPQSAAGAAFHLHPGERRAIPGRENLWVQQLCSAAHLEESMQEAREQALSAGGGAGQGGALPQPVERALQSLAADPALEESLALDTLLDFTTNQAYAHVVFDLDLSGQALTVLQSAPWLAAQLESMDLSGPETTPGLNDTLRQVSRRLSKLAALLSDAAGTAWFVVCQPEEQALAQSVALAERYRALGAPLCGFVLNRVAPPELLQQEIPAFQRQHIQRQRQILSALPERLAGAEVSQAPEMQHGGWDAQQVARLAEMLFGPDGEQEAQ